MNRHVNAIAGRLSLRPPQRHRWKFSTASPRSCRRAKIPIWSRSRSHSFGVPISDGLRARLSFALLRAGHRRRQDAADGCVHQLSASGARHQQLLRACANLTIYNKLIADFTPNTPNTSSRHLGIRHGRPGDHHRRQLRERWRARSLTSLLRCKINIFNISKINSEVRGGKSPRSSGFRNTSARATSSIWPHCPTSSDDGRIAPLPGIGRRAGDQRTEARAGVGTDGNAVCRNKPGARCHLRT